VWTKRKSRTGALAGYTLFFLLAAVCVFIMACLESVVRLNLCQFKEILTEEDQRMVVPGQKTMKLTRSGGYILSYHTAPEGYNMGERPDLYCQLVNEDESMEVPLAPDPVPTGWMQLALNPGAGEQLYSVTIKSPGMYTLVCSEAGDGEGSVVEVSLGPSRVFELLRFLWNVSGPMLLLGLCLSAAVPITALLLLSIYLLKFVSFHEAF